jgi:glutathione synthase/RimK-type ligase-like ATP-grasp enzyme
MADPTYKYDAVLLTDSRYVSPEHVDWYIQNIFDEDRLVREAFEKRGLKVGRTNWDNPDFDWSETRFVVFRSTWDYFDRFSEFTKWLGKVNRLTQLINPYNIIRWNMDKHYLRDLAREGINIPPTVYVEPGDHHTLGELIPKTGWSEMVLKPAVSGGARHTYRINSGNTNAFEAVFKQLISVESMILQEFQYNVISKGELALMLFGGKYSHAVIKKVKAGDYRVQDDFGGSVHEYIASEEEIEFAERVLSVCDPVPVYGRVDVIRDNNNRLSVSELELIEPELWFRIFPEAAELFADAFIKVINQG